MGGGCPGGLAAWRHGEEGREGKDEWNGRAKGPSSWFNIRTQKGWGGEGGAGEGDRERGGGLGGDRGRKEQRT